MEPHEYPSMFALEEHYWWYRALRRRIVTALESWGALPPPATRRPRDRDGGQAVAPPPRCLDAGCGTGMLLAALGTRVYSVGLDFSATALELARRRSLPRLVRASVAQLPLRNDSLDILISADVLYHRGVPDDVAALREAARCLRPGGLLVVNLPAFTWLRSTHDEAVHTARRYTAREVRAKLRRAGLQPLQVSYWNTLLFFPLALVRLGRRWTGGLWRAASTSRAPRPGRGPQSDLTPLPGWLNKSLAKVLALEARLLGTGAPVGLSVLAVARKEGGC